MKIKLETETATEIGFQSTKNSGVDQINQKSNQSFRDSINRSNF